MPSYCVSCGFELALTSSLDPIFSSMVCPNTSCGRYGLLTDVCSTKKPKPIYPSDVRKEVRARKPKTDTKTA